eukprot:scaffold19430_cov18-Tisochrysis_lutea.AAC.1
MQLQLFTLRNADLIYLLQSFWHLALSHALHAEVSRGVRYAYGCCWAASGEYLGVRGMRPLLDSEWQVYSEAALEEWSQKRGAHESALRAVGHSAFFNSRVRHSSLDIR